MLFVLNHLAGLPAVAALPGFEEATPDTAQAVLEEAAHFAGEVLAPLNQPADREPGAWRDGAVTTAPGFKQAFRQYAEAGWQGMNHPAEYGGQGLPGLLGAATSEMLNAANLSFSLCPLLTNGAIEALLTAGSAELRERYIGPMISGKWTGTMNLTEPQAGSDLALLRSRAEPQGDGSYRISGTKIFITYGEHDLAENIIHLVLARLPDAPEGVKGISLFLVPKFLVNADGSLGQRNDVHCVSIEHKLGIKASPTATLQFGDAGGAVGYLIGQENCGLDAMFIMMNAARFAVGMQGVAVSDRAYQHALAYAAERVQSRPVDGSSREAVTIIHHPDVRRILGTMRAVTEAGRALAYYTAGHADLAHASPTRRPARAIWRCRNTWCPSSRAGAPRCRSRSPAWGAGARRHGLHRGDRRRAVLPRRAHPGHLRRHHRDPGQRSGGPQDAARRRRRGALAAGPGAPDRGGAAGPQRSGRHPRGRPAQAAREALASAVDYVLANAAGKTNAVFAAAVPYLMLAGTTLAGWQMARALLASLDLKQEDPEFHAAKIATAQAYALHKLTQAPGLAAVVLGSGEYEVQP